LNARLRVLRYRAGAGLEQTEPAPEIECWSAVQLLIADHRNMAQARPGSAVHMSGHEGQFVSVIPSRALVIVRLGLSRPEEVWNHEAFLVGVLSAFPL
jgi:hypothetical protein